MLVVPVVEGFAVVAPPCFEISGAPHVLLHLHLPVHLGLDHLRLVVKHLPCRGQPPTSSIILLEQLQVLVSGASTTGMGGLMLAKTFLLWAAMICFMFGQVE